MQNFKDVEIHGEKYRIGRLSAGDGSWIAVLVTGKMRDESQREKKPTKSVKVSANAEAAKLTYNEGMMMTATFLIAQLSRTELAEVQAMCLSQCFQYQTLAGAVTPMPIQRDGQWLVPALEYEGPTVLELTKHSLAFNIAPFFPAPALN